ncbi:MAG TPA: 30S ribosomal protein S12 methylthiotransferase RimO [Terriglobales bacterium]|nr:30S ribosomal protein S12 methylthiotransferase RimO [Terriglobales bacterium]
MISLGCAKNLVDAEVMLGHLERAGCTLVQDAADAEVVIVNTCGFIGPARKESIDTILEIAEHKKDGSLKRLVVAGCMVQRYATELRESLPEVDAYLGLDELHKVGDAVGLGALKPSSPQAPKPRIPYGASLALYDHTSPRRRATAPWTGYLKIAEGCDHTCSFCAIPNFRGAFRSRSPESLVAEARAMAAGGVAELNLIAQDSSHYGRDLGDFDGLPHLLARLDAIDELRWIRVHYLYPNTVTERMIEAMAELPKVVPYVDMPLQHAHPETLKRMRRGGSSASHLRLLDRFRRAMPDAALRTTLIVGFPGESEEEFEELCGFVDAARFDHLGVFTYSHEEGTGAYGYADDVPEEVKLERHDRLMQLQQEIALERLEDQIGEKVEVLVEGTHPDTDLLLVGRMPTQAIEVDSQVLINDGVARPGTFVQVELTEVAGYDLVGAIVA